MAAKQSVTLSGLGEEGFDRCAVAILEIQQVISRQLPPNCMDKVQPGSDNGYLTLEFSNRYFSTSKDPQDEVVSMNAYVDPVSVLQEQVTSDAKHFADNKVLYYECQKINRYVLIIWYTIHCLTHNNVVL